MFPIRDTTRSSSFPTINWLLIGLNSLVFLGETALPPAQLERLILHFGIVPVRLGPENWLSFLENPLPLFTLLSHLFLHGGWFHLISNMWTLYIFGDNVEDRMGHGRYLLFYLLSGFSAALAQVMVMPNSNIPVIGASGAIAGVLGAYFLLFPRGRVTTLVILFVFISFIDIPAIVYLGFWFVSQLFSGLASLPYSSMVGGVGWWAHIGGFVFGMVFFRFFLRRRPKMYYYSYPDQY